MRRSCLLYGVLMSGAGPHFPKFPYDIVRIHMLMIYSDIFEYNIVGDTKAALCYDAFILYQRLRMETSSQPDNTWIIKVFQICSLKNLKNSFHSIKLELRDSYGDNVPFKSVGVTRAMLMFRKLLIIIFRNKVVKNFLLIVIQRFSWILKTKGRGIRSISANNWEDSN